MCAAESVRRLRVPFRSARSTTILYKRKPTWLLTMTRTHAILSPRAWLVCILALSIFSPVLPAQGVRTTKVTVAIASVTAEVWSPVVHVKSQPGDAIVILLPSDSVSVEVLARMLAVASTAGEQLQHLRTGGSNFQLRQKENAQAQSLSVGFLKFAQPYLSRLLAVKPTLLPGFGVVRSIEINLVQPIKRVNPALGIQR